MITGLRLSNVRSLIDSGLVELRPITLFLGQNSSGKSSLLRAIPLIKQSLLTRSSSPVLWYGDFVDFGSIEEVRSTLTDSPTVEVGFQAAPFSWSHYGIYYERAIQRFDSLEYTLRLGERDGATKVDGIAITIGDDTLELDFDNRAGVRNFRVNDEDYTRLLPSERYRFHATNVVPQIGYIRRTTKDELFLGGYRIVPPAHRELASLLSERLHNRISTGTINSVARRIAYDTVQNFPGRLREANSSLRSWQRYVETLTSDPHSTELESIRRLALINSLPDILSGLYTAIQSSFMNSAYIGPSRATGERYYRHQELAVDQIDARGQNLPMFLYSLTDANRQRFSDWLSESLGYALKVVRSGGHLQIELRDTSTDQFHNLADVGYGFSQVLPVLAQIWSWEGRAREQESSFVAIEQPELHLHPAYQGLLADIFSRFVQSGAGGAYGSSLLIETHSEALVNRLGELVYEKRLASESVAVYIFERDSASEATSIRKSFFDDTGILNNWPLGFFSSRV